MSTLDDATRLSKLMPLQHDEFGFAVGYLESSIKHVYEKLDRLTVLRRTQADISALRDEVGAIFSDLNKSIERRRAEGDR